MVDPHFTGEMENEIRNEWGIDAYFSSYSSKSRGVAILINNNFDIKVHEKIPDPNGIFFFIDASIVNNRITLIMYIWTKC